MPGTCPLGAALRVAGESVQTVEIGETLKVFTVTHEDRTLGRGGNELK